MIYSPATPATTPPNAPSMKPRRSEPEARRPSAVESVFISYQHAIKRVIARITGSRTDVDDLAQELFLRTVAAEARRPIDNPKAYVFEAARNIARTERTLRSRRVLEVIENAVDTDICAEELSAEAVSVGQERFAMFCEAVALLPRQCRKAFLLRKVYSWSHREIAGALGISESTVEKHIGTALARCAAYIRTHERGEERTARVQQISARRHL
jgi:RNA polymerase sigma factor (sigma-70 family)